MQKKGEKTDLAAQQRLRQKHATLLRGPAVRPCWPGCRQLPLMSPQAGSRLAWTYCHCQPLAVRPRPQRLRGAVAVEEHDGRRHTDYHARVSPLTCCETNNKQHEQWQVCVW